MFADENVSKQITMKGFYVPAALSLMLLSLPIAAQSVATDTILLATLNDSISLDEVVIKAHKTPRANSRWSDLQPVDLVTVGGCKHFRGLNSKVKAVVYWYVEGAAMKHKPI